MENDRLEMPRSNPAFVRPEALVWAREHSGMEIQDVARKVGVRPERVRAWESGSSRPSFKQLIQIAAAYKRPVSAFYLREIPHQPPAIHDFRRSFEDSDRKDSPELLLEVRKSRHRREMAIDLFESLEGSVPEFRFSAQMNEQPDAVAERLRTYLAIAPNAHTAWQSPHEAFNAWRDAIETRYVLVFQATRLPRSEAQGFSISEDFFPVIVVNIKDHPHARAFTLLHECAHLALRQAGVCEPLDELPRLPEDRRIEVFCNAVAGAALVPTALLESELNTARLSPSSPPSIDEVQTLAIRFRVSREVILRRLLSLGRISNAFYADRRQELLQEYAAMTSRRAEGFAPPHRVALSAAGPTFTKLALDALHQDKISLSEVSDLLEVRTKHLRTIEDDLLGAG